MSLMEMDNIAVDTKLWLKVKNNNCLESRAELRKRIHGVTLYLHAFTVKPWETVITLREAEEENIVDSVQISNYGEEHARGS